MSIAKQLFRALTAGDVMTRAAVVLPHEMRMAAATRLLLRGRAAVAPVTDAPGRCVGVLRLRDALRWASGTGGGGEDGGASDAYVWCDWQLVDAGPRRRDEVRWHMTRDPLLVRGGTRLADLADGLGERRRPVVVIDGARRPLGLVSRKRLRAALATVGRPARAGRLQAPAGDILSRIGR